MYKELETKLFNALKSEFDYILQNENDKETRKEKMVDILKIQRIIADFDKIEPAIAEFLDKKAEKDKWER